MQQELYIRSEGIFFAEVGADVYMTLEARDTVMCINRAAFALIENLDGFTNHDDVCAELARVGEIKTPNALKAGNAVIKSLVENRFVKAVKTNTTKGVVCLGSLSGYIAAKQTLNRQPEPADFTPGIRNIWTNISATGGLFINSGDISVIVPNVTDGPIKTCPAHTCTIPAGLFTPDTIIRWFDKSWEKNFKNFRKFSVGKVTKG